MLSAQMLGSLSNWCCHVLKRKTVGNLLSKTHIHAITQTHVNNTHRCTGLSNTTVFAIYRDIQQISIL